MAANLGNTNTTSYNERARYQVFGNHSGQCSFQFQLTFLREGGEQGSRWGGFSVVWTFWFYYHSFLRCAYWFDKRLNLWVGHDKTCSSIARSRRRGVFRPAHFPAAPVDPRSQTPIIFGLSISIEIWIYRTCALGSNLIIANQGINQVERGWKIESGPMMVQSIQVNWCWCNTQNLALAAKDPLLSYGPILSLEHFQHLLFSQRKYGPRWSLCIPPNPHPQLEFS